MNFFKKLRSDNRGAEIQLAVVLFTLLIIFALSLGIDFWHASSAKMLLIKEVESAELYCIVQSVKDDYYVIRQAGDIENLDMTRWQILAVNDMGPATGVKNMATGELYERLDGLSFIEDYEVKRIYGLLYPVGQMGITTEMTYEAKTIINTPDELAALFRDADTETAAGNDIRLKVTSKLVPYVFEE